MRLQGKIAVITGAGRGIGRGIALALAREGAVAALVSRTQSDLEQTAAEIKKVKGEAFALARDLTDPAQVQSVADAVLDKYGQIDILINNAGGYPKEIYNHMEHQAIKIWDWTEEQWDQIIKTNLKIPFLCTNKIIPAMIERRSGHIINISSRMGRIASQMGAYACAKSAVIALTKTTAIQAQEYGVRCNAIAPGILDTPGQRVYNHSVGQDGIKMGNAECMGKAALYLLCDTPDIMTGQVIDIFTTL